MKQRINPYTREVLPAFEQDTQADLVSRLKSLRNKQEQWKALPISDRIQELQESLAYFTWNRDEIALDITREMGRPLAQSRREIDGLLERALYLMDIAPKVLAPESVGEKEGFERAIIHEPLGVVFVIAAWNYPLMIAINGVMASLVAGNTVLLKHSTQTLSVGQHFERAFGNLVQHAIVDHDQAATLIEEHQVDHVIFTGSVAAGRRVYQSAAKGLLDCQLELGGKDGAYVAEDADVDNAAANLVDGAMYNSGQSCCGVERVYVHEKVYEAFIDQCRTLIDKYVLGDPMEEGTDLGPLAQRAAVQVLEEQVADAGSKGAIVLSGGKRSERSGALFFEPTLLTNVTHEMTVMREENFGPIMPVMKVSSDEEAIQLVNDSDLGLTAIIFTKDETRASRFCDEAEVGTVFMNRCDYLDPALPWTGVKQSGIGSALSKYGLLGVTRRKSKHFRIS